MIKATELNLKVSIAVLDAAGHLKVFARMNVARSGSIDVDQLKAGTATRFEVSIRQLAENNWKNENRPYSKFPKVILLAGGLPITIQTGEHLGAIGVSGASADQDELCAQAGINKIQEISKKLRFQLNTQSKNNACTKTKGEGNTS